MSLTTDCGKVSSPAALLPSCHCLWTGATGLSHKGAQVASGHLGGNNNLAVLKKGHLRESSLTVQPAQNLIFSIKRRAKEQKGILRNSVLKVKPTNIETLYCIFFINRPGIQVVLIP